MRKGKSVLELVCAPVEQYMRKGKSVLELVCAPVEVVLNIPMT